MGLVGRPIGCRTQMVMVVTVLAVVPALKLGLLAFYLASTFITAPLHAQAGLLGSNYWLVSRYSGKILTWRPHPGAGSLSTARRTGSMTSK